VLSVLLVGGAGGFYGYAVWEWRGAVTAIREGRPADARKKLPLCLSVWPKDPDVHRLAARAARLTHDFPAAEEHLNICLKLEHGASEDTQLEFLLMRAQADEIDEVAPLLFAYVERRHPDSPMILETIALTYMYHLRYGPAHFALKRWVQEYPDSARAYHYRGWVLERMNQPKLALDDYLRALDLDPWLDRVRIRVAEMYLEDKDPLPALPHLEWVLRRDPDRPEALAALGQCRFLQGRHAEARQLLETAVVKLPDNAPILLHLARLDIADKQPARAEARLRRALAIDPADTEARYVLVTALQFQSKQAEAAAELAEHERHKVLLERANHLLQEEARHPSRDPRVAFEIGSLLLQIRQEKQGLYWMDEALTWDPTHRPTHQALAEYFEQKGDLERAAAHRRRLLK
jgi:tetratricopeptide (TPR) repeat protein